MYYINKMTGDKFLHLANARNIDTMKNQVVFCPVDSTESLSTMNADNFYREFETIKPATKAA